MEQWLQPVRLLTLLHLYCGSPQKERRRRGLDRAGPLSVPRGSRCKRVPFGVPKKNDPNLIPVGEGFGSFLFLGGQHG